MSKNTRATTDAEVSPSDGPLDGSVTGTIGGGGPDTGGPTAVPAAPEIPNVKPENAAGGRRAPDPLGATQDPDDLGPGASDVTNH